MEDSVKFPEKYKTASPELDKQHQEIILILSDIVKLLHSKHSQSKEKTILDEVIGRLRSFAKVHFQYEEDKMRHIEFKDLEDHINEHQRMINFINRIEFRDKADTHKKLKEIELFCERYFVEHIQKFDKPLAIAMKDYLIHHRLK